MSTKLTEEEQKAIDQMLKDNCIPEDAKIGESKGAYDFRKEKEREHLNASKPKNQ